MTTFKDVSNALRMLLEEQGTPRNVREKVNGMLKTIQLPGEARMKADKLLMELEDLQSDVNIPSYVRTQIWGISGMLENLEE